MERVIVNKQNANVEDTVFGSSCCRAILVDRGNVLIEKHPNGAFLLPGFFYNEDAYNFLIKYLKNSLGVSYNNDTLKEIFLLEHFQKIFSFDDELDIMRLVKTKYFLGQYKGIDFSVLKNEDYNKFKLMDIDEIIDLTSTESSNNIVKFCNEDTNEALKVLKKVR